MSEKEVREGGEKKKFNFTNFVEGLKLSFIQLFNTIPLLNRYDEFIFTSFYRDFKDLVKQMDYHEIETVDRKILEGIIGSNGNEHLLGKVMGKEDMERMNEARRKFSTHFGSGLNISLRNELVESMELFKVYLEYVITLTAQDLLSKNLEETLKPIGVEGLKTRSLQAAEGYDLSGPQKFTGTTQKFLEEVYKRFSMVAGEKIMERIIYRPLSPEAFVFLSIKQNARLFVVYELARISKDYSSEMFLEFYESQLHAKFREYHMQRWSQARNEKNKSTNKKFGEQLSQSTTPETRDMTKVNALIEMIVSKIEDVEIKKHIEDFMRRIFRNYKPLKALRFFEQLDAYYSPEEITAFLNEADTIGFFIGERDFSVPVFKKEESVDHSLDSNVNEQRMVDEAYNELLSNPELLTYTSFEELMVKAGYVFENTKKAEKQFTAIVVWSHLSSSRKRKLLYYILYPDHYPPIGVGKGIWIWNIGGAFITLKNMNTVISIQNHTG